jgi:hypothetical protein
MLMDALSSIKAKTPKVETNTSTPMVSYATSAKMKPTDEDSNAVCCEWIIS